MGILRIGLCAGRHEIFDDGVPVEKFVFADVIENPHDFDMMQNQASSFIVDLFTEDVNDDTTEIHLFVTGLTAALVSTLQAYNSDIPLVLRHFNRDTGEYSHQIL